MRPMRLVLKLILVDRWRLWGLLCSLRIYHLARTNAFVRGDLALHDEWRPIVSRSWHAMPVHLRINILVLPCIRLRASTTAEGVYLL